MDLSSAFMSMNMLDDQQQANSPWEYIQQPRQAPNIDRIPPGLSNIRNKPRRVLIGHRLVAEPVISWGSSVIAPFIGMAGGPSEIPNPAYQWCVIVGYWCHQLQTTDFPTGWSFYDNDRFSWKDGWNCYDIGRTSGNNVAIREAAEQALNSMPERYNILNNHCQTFTLALLDIILNNPQPSFDTEWDANWLTQEAWVSGETPELHAMLLAKAHAIMSGHVPSGVQPLYDFEEEEAMYDSDPDEAMFDSDEVEEILASDGEDSSD